MPLVHTAIASESVATRIRSQILRSKGCEISGSSAGTRRSLRCKIVTPVPTAEKMRHHDRGLLTYRNRDDILAVSAPARCLTRQNQTDHLLSSVRLHQRDQLLWIV